MSIVGYSESAEEGQRLFDLIMALGYTDLQSFQLGRNPEWFDNEDTRALLLEFIRMQKRLYTLQLDRNRHDDECMERLCTDIVNSPHLMQHMETLDLSDCLFKSRENRENFCMLIETAVHTKIFRVSLQFPDLRLHIRTEPVEGNPNRSTIIFKELEGRMREVYR